MGMGAVERSLSRGHPQYDRALDDVDGFYWVHYTFAFLFIDAYSEHIYFVDKVCMQTTQSGTCISVIVHSFLLQLDY